ncbi:hypothetical protein BMS3Abin04_01163 [bacterium BMS3Abin04]|nr:hypothetical protein BMS3Abin04_01163 [bacterium BMS3Abin04]
MFNTLIFIKKLRSYNIGVKLSLERFKKVIRIGTYLILTFFLVFLNSCESATGVGNSENQVSLKTDKTSYTVSDSINIVLNNNSVNDIIVGLRCGEYLEMDYQQKEGNTWSDNRMFWYMSLGCLTKIDTIKSKQRYDTLLKTELFKVKGIFRLVLRYAVTIVNKEEKIYSNAFEIR